MKISQFAKAAGVSVETIRYYQRIGLLSMPIRTAAFREYGPTDLARLTFVRRAQALGFTLEEVSTLLQLSASDCKDVARIARERLHTVAQKIADLNRIAEVLRNVVTRCDASAPHQACPIIETLVGA